MAITVFHASVRCSDDYQARHGATRDAHHAQLERWRAGGQLVGCGLAPEGGGVDLFWRARDVDEVTRLMAEDRFVLDGLWAADALRPFSAFVEPAEAPPIDGSRQATIVEGRATDAARARKALVDL